MSQSQQSSASGMTWIMGAVISLLVILAIFAGTRIFDNNSDTVEAEVLMTPVAGGLAVPTSTPAPEATSTENVADDETDGPANYVQPGTRVMVATPRGNGVVLRADAGRDMPAMSAYDEGAFFVIVEPSGDYDEYPVESDGVEWYRIRAEDGLVGWIEAGMVLVSE